MKKNEVTPPVAPKFPKKMVHHGDIRIDDYFWMRDRQHPETMKYLHAENAYFTAQMKPLQGLKNKLYQEMKARIQENESTVPAPSGNYLYSSQFKKGLQYSQLVRQDRVTKKFSIYLDGNILAKGQKYFDMGNVHISPNENIVSYAVDFDGSERYAIHFKDLLSGKVLSEKLTDASGSSAWAKDSRTFFYVKLDRNLRPYQVYRHQLGTNPKSDQLMYEEKDSQFFVSVSSSSSEEYLYIHTGGKITDEVWFLSANDPMGEFQCIEKRRDGLEYQVSDRFGEFWINTNWRAENFQIMKTSIRSPGKKNWQTVIKHSPKTLREGLSVFADHMVISEREAGLPQIRIYDFNRAKDHVLEFPDQAYEVSLSVNAEFQTQKLRISYSSPITPPSVLEYDLTNRKMRTLKVKVVKGHQPKRYVCKRVWAKSHDGVKIPLTLVMKKGVKPNGKSPGYLYGYGSYGASMPEAFPARRDIYRLVDRGFVYALAHPRGGSEMGRSWYEDGKFLKKKNTFLDFIACGEYLIQSGWVKKDKLAACGGSAGGMLMGACLNMRPDLFSAVAAHVPFVDVINTMFDKDLPLTQIEYKEWGNPADPQYYRYMKSYSPYDNVVSQDYPPLFITCGLNDPRVTYWEPAKWTAKLRELKTDKNKILFKINMGAGHFGDSGRFHHLWEQAEEFAFLLHQFGIR